MVVWEIPSVVDMEREPYPEP